MNFIITDSENPAFVLNDKNVKFGDKALFVFGQKWCWGLLFLMILIGVFTSMVLMILVATKQEELFRYLSGERWDALPPKEDLMPLKLPVTRVIVTHTNDFLESCTTEVRT